MLWPTHRRPTPTSPFTSARPGKDASRRATMSLRPRRAAWCMAVRPSCARRQKAEGTSVPGRVVRGKVYHLIFNSRHPQGNNALGRAHIIRLFDARPRLYQGCHLPRASPPRSAGIEQLRQCKVVRAEGGVECVLCHNAHLVTPFTRTRYCRSWPAKSKYRRTLLLSNSKKEMSGVVGKLIHHGLFWDRPREGLECVFVYSVPI